MLTLNSAHQSLNTDREGLSSRPTEMLKRQEEAGYTYKDIDSHSVKQKFGKKQSDIRYYNTACMAVTSLVAKQVNKGLNSVELLV